MKINISIIISLFNKEKYISRAIESVLLQTKKDYELIIIDAGSTDSSYSIAFNYSKKYDNIKLFSQKNQGFSAAKNFGAQQSINQYITFLDADDYWEPNFLQNISKLIIEYPNCSMYATAYKKHMENCKELVVYNSKSKSGIIRNYFLHRLTGWGLHTSSTVFDKEKFVNAGLFPNLVGSVRCNKIWLINGNGEIIYSFENKHLQGRKIKIETGLIKLPEFMKGINDLMIELPGPIGEDQLLHDFLALTTNASYTQVYGSNWDGNILDQTTKRDQYTNIYWHYMNIYQLLKNKIHLNKKSNEVKLRLYLRFLITFKFVSLLKRAYTNDGLIEIKEFINNHKIDKLLGIKRRIFISIQILFLYVLFITINKYRIYKNEKYSN